MSCAQVLLAVYEHARPCWGQLQTQYLLHTQDMQSPSQGEIRNVRQERQRRIHELFDEYIEMYAVRDDRLTTRFSQNFTGFTGSWGG